MTNIISPHGGYKDLKSYQNSVIVHDLTVEFCRLYIPSRSRTTDQMEQAARSGKQNIVEGSSASGHSKLTELRLMGVARASLEELLEDYKDFLRQHSLSLWDKDREEAKEVRQLAYMSDRSYKTYISSANTAANCAVILIHQTNFLLDQQIRALEKALVENGNLPDRIKHVKKEQLFNSGPSTDDFLAEFGLKRLANGQVVKKGEENI